MKRPQFSLRLMLLLVTLFATFFAWKRAVAVKSHTELEGRIMALQDKIHALEQERADFVERRQGPVIQSFRVNWDAPLPIDSLINAARQELKTLKSDQL